jgi:hypothetical protein
MEEDPGMSGVEHILLESDERDVPTLETARRVHARIALPAGRWKPALELALIDYYYLSVRTARSRDAGHCYVLDLRFVDPAARLGRRVPWPWIGVGAVFLSAAYLGAREIAASSVPWWRHEWLPATSVFLAAAAAALCVAAHRVAETLTLFSAHGRAKLMCHAGGLGTLRAFRRFLPRLEAHLRIACARRRGGAEHLRDEMREHFRLRQAGALTEAEYEAAKRRILSTHGHSAAGRGPGKGTARGLPTTAGRKLPPTRGIPLRRRSTGTG